VDALHQGDSVGVVTFDTQPTWAVPITILSDDATKDQVKAGVTAIAPGGGTNIHDSVALATDSISTLAVKTRHVVVLTDGFEFGTHDYDPILKQITDNHISLTTVGIGRDVDRALLTRLAQQGGGRFYFTEQVLQIPKIIVKDLDISLKQNTSDDKATARAEAASPLLRGIDPTKLPALNGYNLTTPKPDATTALSTDQEDPLLAHWQYGLGRVVAFASGAGPGWAANWVAWNGFAGFWDGVVRWALPSPVARDLQPTINVAPAGGDGDALGVAHLRVESLLPDNSFADLATVQAALRAPSGAITQTLLTQTAPGRYEADLPVAEAGAYEVRVTRKTGYTTTSESAGFTVPLDPELLHAGINDSLLRRLAAGRAYLTDPAQAFADRKPLPSTADGEPLWPYTLAAALLALLAGVAVRRLDWPRRRPPAPAI
jgi:hypothetical protein